MKNKEFDPSKIIRRYRNYTFNYRVEHFTDKILLFKTFVEKIGYAWKE